MQLLLCDHNSMSLRECMRDNTHLGLKEKLMLKKKMAYAWHGWELQFHLLWGDAQWPIWVHFDYLYHDLLPLPLFHLPHPSYPLDSFVTTFLKSLPVRFKRLSICEIFNQASYALSVKRNNHNKPKYFFIIHPPWD